MSTADEDEDTSPSPHEEKGVLRRALVLSAVVCRGFIEKSAGQPEAESVQGRVLAWLTRLNLWVDIEPSERAILRAPLGRLSAQEVIRATWCVEGLAVLAWALKRLDKLPYQDVMVDPYEITDAVLFLNDQATATAVRGVRSLAELKACRELYYAIHCRLRSFARKQDPCQFSQWLDREWFITLEMDPNRVLIQDDLAIGGKPLIDVPDQQVKECESAVCERHRAIIWLYERSPFYSQTPVDT
jgi:hypothetical protein